MRISDWSSDVCSSDLVDDIFDNRAMAVPCYAPTHTFVEKLQTISTKYRRLDDSKAFPANFLRHYYDVYCLLGLEEVQAFMLERSEEHTSELQSLMRISYAVFCLKKKKNIQCM